MLPTRLQLSTPRDYSAPENTIEKIISNKFTLETERIENDLESLEKDE